MHDGDGILKWVLKVFLREWVCDMSGPYVVLFDYGLFQEGVKLRDSV